MSYCITSLVLYDSKMRKITRRLDKDSKELIESGYYPEHYNKTFKPRLVKLSKELGKVILEVNGDYGHYFEIWESGKKVKEISSEKLLKSLIEEVLEDG